MPVTSKGVEYTVHENGTMVYGIADKAHDVPGRPTILYAHGNAGAYNQFASSGSWKALRDWVIDNGWAWVESDCGGGNSWGNTAARDDQREALEWAMTQISIGDIVVLGRSMGGLVSYWLYLYDSLIAAKATGLIINSGTTDLYERVRWNTTNGSQTIMNAYGANNLADFDVASIGHDPMLFPVEDWAGKNVLQIYGTADEQVPPAMHAIPWIEKYGASTGGGAVLDVMRGGDHGGWGTYLQTARMSSFLTARGSKSLSRLASGDKFYRPAGFST